MMAPDQSRHSWFRSGTFWGILLSVVGLAATFAAPIVQQMWQDHHNSAEIQYQLVVEPVPGAVESSGRSRYVAILTAINSGPATAKFFISRILLGTHQVHLLSAPYVTREPSGGTAKVYPVMEPAIYEVAVSNLAPGTGLTVVCEFSVAPELRATLGRLWPRPSGELVGHFISEVQTTGDNIRAVDAGYYPVPMK